ncbi:MAG: endonuclease MutS2 [Bacteroidales bacterium]|nr:endonuclease MutS2 [Bacteroidales bacterium]
MIYPQNFEEKTGFDKIRQMLRDNTLCGLGVARVDSMQFMADRRAIDRELALTREMMHVRQNSQNPLPTDCFYDVTEPLKKIRVVGTFLETAELFALRRSLATIEALVRYFKPDEGEADSHPLLSEQAATVVTFPDIARTIDRTLTPNGEIRDNASPELANIRHEMSTTLNGISRLLNNILRSAQNDGLVEKDVTPAMRDGRLVIPIPPSSKRKLRGIVHDESATGKTLYVEPAEVVDANNRIRELESEERQEIVRILTAIANQIRPYLPDMLASYDFLGLIDFLHAKARFAESIEATVPSFSADGATDWVQARHPLLDLRYRRENKKIVPLDILLDHRDKRIVLISGPNAGGKSVCLESLGLIQYMLQCGLAVPMKDNSQVTVYENIFIDIGDEQSIDNDLSTYSSHLQNMKFFVRNANNRTLLLIDEFGSGTEPQIGGAIAQALLGKFNVAKANGVITTHFTNLKLFADETPGIVNGAMLYDRREMRPLFRLEVGRPGSSFAIEIAHKIGLPNDVISEAERLVGSDYVNMDKYLQDISRDKRYWEQKREKIHQQEKALEQKLADYDAKSSELKTKRQEVLQKARDEAATLFKEANARIERTIREIKEAQAEKEATRKIREEHANFVEQRIARAKSAKPEQKPKPTAQNGAPKPIEVGNYVRIKGQNTIGEVLATDGRKVQVTFGIIKSMIESDKLEVVSKNQAKKDVAADKIAQFADNLTGTKSRSGISSVDVMSEKRKNFKSELDVRGMRADEALQAVMYFLDDAQLLSANEVRILHGTGTGALRVAIRQYLGTRACVLSFRDEHVQFGGAGITVVELM